EPQRVGGPRGHGECGALDFGEACPRGAQGVAVPWRVDVKVGERRHAVDGGDGLGAGERPTTLVLAQRDRDRAVDARDRVAHRVHDGNLHGGTDWLARAWRYWCRVKGEANRGAVGHGPLAAAEQLVEGAAGR